MNIAPTIPPRQTPDDGATVDRLKALAHPIRLGIVTLIARHGGDLCVCHLQKHFDVSQPTISHHLKILREAGVIRSNQVGTWVHHELESDAVEVLADHLAGLANHASTRQPRCATSQTATA